MVTAARLDFQGFGGVPIVGDAFGSPDDPAVLLIPSTGQSRAFWHGSARALADAGRYAICVDLRGHGDSGHASDGRYDLDAYVGDLKAVLAALPSRAVVVAAGLGALVAIAAIGESTAPLISGLVLVDANIWFDSNTSARLHSAFSRLTTVFASADDVLKAIISLHPDEPSLVARERLLAAYERDGSGGFRWRGDPRAVMTADIRGARERLAAAAAQIRNLPVTLIRGSLNSTISAEAVDRLQSMIEGSESAEIEGAGHYAAAEREEAFNAVLLEFLERRAPRQPISYIGGAEPRVLRDALGCFGTGVTVVTSFDGEGEPIGFTANSFSSLSLDPPLIIFSLAKTSGSLESFVAAGRFAVNVLHIGQQPIANRFARRDAPRFDGVDWTTQADKGSPILRGALASFDCTTYAMHEGGDHLIFVGQVNHAWFEPHRDPLLYFRGRYRRLHFA
ncbi:alpha/beta fold hydrolase [Sphingobium tyrosinilyticum]|uniref:Alpha/beta fold hydrolase n=1 Tax=Sphingobium tyrosinilyticum TaxID=2715436 RepID=A0ABV9F3V1_9SPHN